MATYLLKVLATLPPLQLAIVGVVPGLRLLDNVPARGQLQLEGADLAEEVADDAEGRHPGADSMNPFQP
jgi:hypothetical protein